MHLGLIGGIGPAATDYYYRGLIDRHAAAGTVLDLTIVHADAREMTGNLARGDAQSQAHIFAALIGRLAAAGAIAAAITSMGGHFCIRELEAISPLPLVNGVVAVNAAIANKGFKRVGVIGTRTVMETRLYGAVSAEVVAPAGGDLNEVHQAYIDMAISGRVTEAQREIFFSAGEALCRAQGAQAVMLGGTDLCLAFDGQDCGFPLIDCAAIHIDAIYARSVADAPAQ